MPVSVTQTQTIPVQAIFETVYTVYFCYKDRTVATKELTDTQPSVSTGDVLVPVGADEKLTGWYIGEKRYETVSKADFLDGSDTLTLTAKVDKGHWIHFNSAGGSYVAPQFVTGNTIPPADPARPGFSFEGWYEESGNRFTFGNQLTSNITLTAHWRSNTSTKYTVIHWQEKADESGWSLHETETKTGGTGAQTAAAAKSYDGFTAQTITQQTINGDGSTIVNAYYKRNVYEVKFYTLNGRTEYKQFQIRAKYGANIRDRWPTHNNSSTWAVNLNASGSKYQSNIDTMPLGGKNFYGPVTGYGSETAYYYTEALPGETGTVSYKGKQYKLDHSDTAPGKGYSITEEDKYPITGFTFLEFDAKWNGGIFPPRYAYNGAKFYYTRNSYDVVFISGSVTEKTQSMNTGSRWMTFHTPPNRR